MRMAPRRRCPGVPPTAARKAKTAVQMRSRDASLEAQAEQATQLALRGDLNVARVLTPAPAAHVEAPLSTGAPAVSVQENVSVSPSGSVPTPLRATVAPGATVWSAPALAVGG